MTESIDKQLERSNKLSDEREERKRELISAFVKATGEIGRVEKDRENPFAKSKYATLDAILDEVKPILSKHDLALSQIATTRISRMNEKEYEICVVNSVYHKNGESLDLGELSMPLEKGRGMNLAQSAGSTITYCRRYSVTSIFGISTGEDTDGILPQTNEGEPKHQKHPSSYKDDGAADRQKAMLEAKKEIDAFKKEITDNGGDINKTNDWICEKESVGSIQDVTLEQQYRYYKATVSKMRIHQNKKQQTSLETTSEKDGTFAWGPHNND